MEFKSNIPIGVIIKVNFKGFTLWIKAENENIFFNLTLYGPDLAPK
jgi:hypothetical protein